MNTSEISAFLETYDPYIVALSRKEVMSRSTVCDRLGEEAEELAQRVRIKLWHVLEKSHIIRHKPYIRQAVRHEFIDMMRGKKESYRLLLDEEGEIVDKISLNNWIICQENDPYIMFVHQEMFTEYLTRIVANIITLAPHQYKAMVYLLREEVDDALLLSRVFKAQNVSIEKIELPREERALRVLKASVSPARKKLTVLRDEFFPSKKRKCLAS